MADGTRAQVTLKETVRCETEEALESRFTAIEGLVADQNQKFDKHLAKMFDAIRLLSATHNSSGEKQHYDRNSPIAASTSDLGFTTTDRDKMVKSGTQNPYAGLIRVGKDDFPRFDGDKIREWLFKVEEFFEIAGTPNGLKVGLASAHFDGLAATWHRLFVQPKLGRNDIHDWNTYKMLLEEQFEEVLEDPIAELKQLRETNGIAEYHMKFELLRTRVNLTEDELVRSFLDGLQPETQVNVKMFQPQTVSQCLLIGRLYERAHPKMVLNQSGSGSKWSGYGNELKGIPASRAVTVKVVPHTNKENKLEENTFKLQHKNSGIPMIDCDEDQLSCDDNKLVNIEVTTSTDLLLSEERDSSPLIAIGCELEAGETDTSIDQNQLIQEEAKNHSIDSFQETSLLHHKSSLLKHQVPISHWEFSHRSPIESLDVYDDWPSAIVRTHQSQSNVDLEYAAINAYQVCDSMSLGTKLLTSWRRKTFLKTWRFKFKIRNMRGYKLRIVKLLLKTSLVVTWFWRWFMMVNRYEQYHMLEHANMEAQSCPFPNFAAEQPLLWMQNNSEPILILSELERKKKKLCLKIWMYKYKFDEEDQGLLQSRTGWTQEEPAVIRFLLGRHLYLNLDCEAPELAGRKRNHCCDWSEVQKIGVLFVVHLWSPQMNLWSTSYHVWHRWKARYCFVGIISTMWAWLFGEGGFDIGKEMTRGGSGLKKDQWLR